MKSQIVKLFEMINFGDFKDQGSMKQKSEETILINLPGN